jgi:hypothetical protein
LPSVLFHRTVLDVEKKQVEKGFEVKRVDSVPMRPSRPMFLLEFVESLLQIPTQMSLEVDHMHILQISFEERISGRAIWLQARHDEHGCW